MSPAIDVAAFRRALDARTNERTPLSREGPLVVVPLTRETEDFLEAHAVPAELRAFVREFSFGDEITLGHTTFGPGNGLADRNVDEMNVRCLEGGLLAIGDGLNGDPIVVDLRDGSTGFVNHDELWEEDGPPARESFVGTGLDVGTFLAAAVVHAARFPRDAYEARETAPEVWASFRAGLR